MVEPIPSRGSTLLHEFLTKHREEILRRVRNRVAERAPLQSTPLELSHGIPLFLDELVTTLLEGDTRHTTTIDRDAIRHGGQRERAGFTIAQVVHDYGDICQVVTQLAIEARAPIPAEDFSTLNRCLDQAIAEAVGEFSRRREADVGSEAARHLGFVAHEFRNALQTASLAFSMLQSGSVPVGGSTGALLRRSLDELRSLVDRGLTQVRLDGGRYHLQPVAVDSFLEEMEATGIVLAQDAGSSLTVAPADRQVAVRADRQLLGSAVTNLLQNAFKFTPEGGRITLRSATSGDRVSIEVEDRCGGLPSGGNGILAEGAHRGSGSGEAGLGLGLAISKRAVEAMGGALSARDVPGVGCVFRIELPRVAAG